MPRQKSDPTEGREGMDMGRLVDLILFEPKADMASWNVDSLPRIELVVEADKRVSQLVPFFLGNLRHVSANSVFLRHGQTLLLSLLIFGPTIHLMRARTP